MFADSCIEPENRYNSFQIKFLAVLRIVFYYVQICILKQLLNLNS